MQKVRTFTEHLESGEESARESLDVLTSELRAETIHSVSDEIQEEGIQLEMVNGRSDTIVRTVIFTPSPESPRLENEDW